MTIPKNLDPTSAGCENYFKKSRAGNFPPFAWKCSPWACLTILRSPSKRDRLAFVLGLRSLVNANQCGAQLERSSDWIAVHHLSAYAGMYGQWSEPNVIDFSRKRGFPCNSRRLQAGSSDDHRQ